MILVELNRHELDHATNVGRQRQIASGLSGLKDKHGLDPSKGWSVHLVGACGEMCVAKLLGIYWPGDVNTFKTVPDLGEDIEVRTAFSDRHGLILRQKDSPDRYYWYVTGTQKINVFIVQGWIQGKDGMEDIYISRPDPQRPPCWVIPAQVLNKTIPKIYQKT